MDTYLAKALLQAVTWSKTSFALCRRASADLEKSIKALDMERRKSSSELL